MRTVRAERTMGAAPDGDRWGTGAHVVRESTFAVPAGPASGPLTAVTALSVRRGFERILEDVERRPG